MSSTGTRIWWTEDEQERVVEAMAQQLRTQPRSRYPEVWAAGNGVMAADRQRKWYSSFSGKANPANKLFVEARKRAAQPAGERVGEAVAHVPKQQESEVTWVPVPTPQALSEVPLKELLSEVIERVLTRLAPEQLPGGIEDAAQRQIARNVEAFKQSLPKITLSPRPVRVALCGPMANQFRRVRERINAKRVELVWVDNQKSVTQQDFAGGLDHVIVTRFIRHSHTELAQQSVGKQRVHWTQQGTDSIVAKVCEVVPGSAN